ncbi:MAG: methyltransferase domain-containing protein [Salinivirgaceae bacterium]|nr:methyltransferase domain-containing protein [Salinivirgaceae bacterium]
MNFKNYINRRKNQKYFCTNSRIPFYNIAKDYIPEDAVDFKILDIGVGKGEFAAHINLLDYSNMFQIEGNLNTVELLKKKYPNILHLELPNRIPLESNSLNLIHSSHLVEHLNHKGLFEVLQEMNRLLVENGILVLSAPMLSDFFYDDLSHIKPYNPVVFINYLSAIERQASNKAIADNYVVERLQYRYGEYDVRGNEDEGVFSHYYLIDFVIRVRNLFVKWLKIKAYKRTGYTLVLRKRVS